MRWRIRGGRPLQGRARVGGAKNTAFKVMIAALLGEGPSIIENVPDVEDVRAVARAIAALGGEARCLEPGTWIVDPRSLTPPTSREVSALCSSLGRSRASSLLMVPLLVRFGEALVPKPTGDPIGRRPVDRLLQGLDALGARVQEHEEHLLVHATRLRGARFRFPKNTHTGTEALLLAAVRAEGETLLENAAQEPEVDDLIAFLNAMGARIRRLQERTIHVRGVSSLRGARHRVMPDRNEAVTLACAALVTRGDIEIEGVRLPDVRAFLEVIRQMGALSEESATVWRIASPDRLRPVQIRTAPHPGFMTDWHPLIVPVLTQAHGVSTLHETVFENRFQYAQQLRRMGARLEFFTPPVEDPEATYNFNLSDDRPEFFHALRVYGPTPLRAAEVVASDIRGGAALILAALAASGESVVLGIEHVERGYERLDDTLRALGAWIVAEEEDRFHGEMM